MHLIQVFAVLRLLASIFLLHLSLFVCFGFEHLFHLLATNDAFDSLPYVHCSFFYFIFFIRSFIWLFVPRWFLFVRIFCSSSLCLFFLFDHSFLLFVFAIVYSFIRSFFFLECFFCSRLLFLWINVVYFSKRFNFTTHY